MRYQKQVSYHAGACHPFVKIHDSTPDPVTSRRSILISIVLRLFALHRLAVVLGLVVSSATLRCGGLVLESSEHGVQLALETVEVCL